ncbi:hypothetical protein ANABIO4_14370 [Bacillus subtilis]|nr:hypothetical protein ANABIO4_14370 [Bacillus subtilis]
MKGFSEVSRYMFGDPIANDQGFKPAGLSAFAVMQLAIMPFSHL